jgi:hypothetical protein
MAPRIAAASTTLPPLICARGSAEWVAGSDAEKAAG